MEDSAASPAHRLFHQGEQFLDAGDPEAAAQAFQEALALQPDWPEALANLGFARELQGLAGEAEMHYRHALTLQPDNATMHLNLGALLALQKRHGEAEASYAAALALGADSSAVWSNLGALNLNLKREETAEACLRQAIALDPDNARARFNLAYLQLQRGQWEEGWELFESRLHLPPLPPQPDGALWQGESLQDQSLLVVCERGHGDVIQFCRYLPWLKAQGLRALTLLCPPALKALLQSMPEVDAVLAFDETMPEADFDFWMPLLSAPYRAQSRPHTLPATLPYLQPDVGLRAHWAARLPVANGLRVGLVWKGNPQFENDRDRSLPHLQTLAPLWQVPGVQFVGLQKGAGEQDTEQNSTDLTLVVLGPELRDFADAAAVIDQLDLLISVDTATAHLAGALGKPCWLLLPWYMTDWRWGAEGTQSAWYPGVMRLFRQPREGDWDSVVTELQSALRALSAGH